jgi:hypothetical protein
MLLGCTNSVSEFNSMMVVWASHCVQGVLMLKGMMEDILSSPCWRIIFFTLSITLLPLPQGNDYFTYVMIPKYICEDG